MKRTLFCALGVLLLAGCPDGVCATDGGCGLTPAPTPDPGKPYSMQIFVQAFDAQVDITGISYSDGYCMMSGGTVSSKFRLNPLSMGKAVGDMLWDPNTKGSMVLEFNIDSDATVAAQNGQSDPGAPLDCSATSDHFTNNTYRTEGVITVLGGVATMTSPMPQDDDTYGNIGCPPMGSSCHVNYTFDNTPGVARTTLDVDALLSGGEVVMPIAGDATNVASAGETRSGHFHWSGSITLRGVAVR